MGLLNFNPERASAAAAAPRQAPILSGVEYVARIFAHLSAAYSHITGRSFDSIFEESISLRPQDYHAFNNAFLDNREEIIGANHQELIDFLRTYLSQEHEHGGALPDVIGAVYNLIPGGSHSDIDFEDDLRRLTEFFARRLRDDYRRPAAAPPQVEEQLPAQPPVPSGVAAADLRPSSRPRSPDGYLDNQSSRPSSPSSAAPAPAPREQPADELFVYNDANAIQRLFEDLPEDPPSPPAGFEEEPQAAAAAAAPQVHPEFEREDSLALVLSLASVAYAGTLALSNQMFNSREFFHASLVHLGDEGGRIQEAYNRINGTKIVLYDNGIFIPRTTGDFNPIIDASDAYFHAIEDGDELNNVVEAVVALIPEAQREEARELARRSFIFFKHREAPEA